MINTKVIGIAPGARKYIAEAVLCQWLSLTLASGERVLDLLDEKPVVEYVDDSKDIDFSGAECKNLRFSYGEGEILRDLSVGERQRVGLARVLIRSALPAA